LIYVPSGGCQTLKAAVKYPNMGWQASEGAAKQIQCQEQIEKIKKSACNYPAVMEEVQSIKSR